MTDRFLRDVQAVKAINDKIFKDDRYVAVLTSFLSESRCLQ